MLEMWAEKKVCYRLFTFVYVHRQKKDCLLAEVKKSSQATKTLAPPDI